MNIFQTAPGCSIPYPDQIREEYEVRESHSILANISFPHLRPLVEEVFHSLPEPLFFVLQLPLSVQEEQLLRYPRGQAGQEVLYLDNQSLSQIEAIWQSYGSLLLADGLSQFAIASQKSHQEIFVQKYKITALFSPSPGNLSRCWNTTVCGRSSICLPPGTPLPPPLPGSAAGYPTRGWMCSWWLRS